ncbi:calcium-binding protein [Methylobacterium sp. WL19]|uniref:calcium-binding protein n=1 Tax=Methylobacterium sp. WL19 TaxID=2603896 RepID=UPI0011C9EF7A|nr:calcium-binding protein [Methylobacterium sp. WL19]TXN27140.1 calcium-binding protein [Methylobacterium sp. WL19]
MATINGDNGDNFLTGTEEEDTINGRGGNDTIDSVDRPANIFAGSIDPRRDVVNAGSGDDFVTGGKLDRLIGGEGNDFLSVNFNFNGPVVGSGTPIRLTLNENGTGRASDGTVIKGFESVNFNLSDTGDNVVDTGDVRAQLTGGNGNDRLTTGSADDVVYGGGGRNVISTGAGNDTIGGGSGTDIVSGGDGDDTFGVNVYTDGRDRVDLGAGDDTVRFDRNDGGTGNIRLTFTSAEVGNGTAYDSGSLTNQDGGLAVHVQAEDADGNLTGPVSRYDDEGTTFIAGTQGITFDVRDLVSGTERGNTFEGVVLGTDGDDTLSFFPPFREGQDFYYNAGQGDDTITAGTGKDFIVGGVGNDTVTAGAGSDTVLGQDGKDTLFGEAGDDRLNGGAGDDTLSGDDGNDELGGGTGDDILVGSEGNDTLFGEDGKDRLNGGAGDDIFIGGAGNDELGGGIGNDVLVGNEGVDSLFGEAGNDTLDGGAGNDILLGGSGADQFNFGTNSGADIITDFSFADGDRLALFGQTYVTQQDEFGNASLALSGGGFVTLSGISPQELEATFFA